MTTQTPPQPLPERHEVRLEERYTAESGPVMLGGIQALVRLMLDLRRLDRRRGHDTGVFVSGYQGSPLGGLDQELAREQPLLAPEGIVFHAGLNEELAATAVGGTQLLGQLPGATKQGVTGFWYGKNPGFDRAADAIRHSTLSGTAPLGGAVALIGDDPTSKSSTVPSACESMCRTLAMPVLAPGTISELVEYGLHAVALSRHAGLWTGLKVVADLADASGVVQAGAALDAIPQLPLRPATDPPVLLPPSNLVAEQDLFTTRLERVHEYARLTKLNRITFDPGHARIGVIASGVGYQAVLRALELLGLEQADMERLGLRLIKLGMPWPLQPDDLRALVSGLHAVLVVEDKLPFVESQLKEALYHEPGVPLVFGKRDHEGKPLLPVGGAVGADEIAQALAQLVPGLELPRVATLEPLADLSKRTPYFCSGCPHNTS
ncbi:MAG TPA: indolepyruvate ferredoxin oxidoreductase family protein, partial [Solirubrobacteraceae bacterium]|nr:indolepyruvate ferredoxin oxidoreductase family protein [Solirubrobacteraceae bacterium]